MLHKSKLFLFNLKTVFLGWALNGWSTWTVPSLSLHYSGWLDLLIKRAFRSLHRFGISIFFTGSKRKGRKEGDGILAKSGTNPQCRLHSRKTSNWETLQELCCKGRKAQQRPTDLASQVRGRAKYELFSSKMSSWGRRRFFSEITCLYKSSFPKHHCHLNKVLML